MSEGTSLWNGCVLDLASTAPAVLRRRQPLLGRERYERYGPVGILHRSIVLELDGRQELGQTLLELRIKIPGRDGHSARTWTIPAGFKSSAGALTDVEAVVASVVSDYLLELLDLQQRLL